MSPEEKELLERTYRLAEENNGILKGMRRSQRIGSAMKAVYWTLIIALTVGGYYFAQIYIKSITDALSITSDNAQSSSLVNEYLDLLK